MHCNITNIEIPIFRVLYQFLDNPKYKKVFYFIGKVEENINKILKKLEKKSKITKKEKELLKKEFKYDYSKILKYNESKSDLYFINDKIYLNDTIIIIKKKYFIIYH